MPHIFDDIRAGKAFVSLCSVDKFRHARPGDKNRRCYKAPASRSHLPVLFRVGLGGIVEQVAQELEKRIGSELLLL